MYQFDTQLPDPFPARRVLLGVAGSIAAAALPGYVSVMRHVLGLEVRAVLTRQAATLVAPRALAAACGAPVVVDGDSADEAGTVPHIELPRWADLLLVMPATANLLAKAAHGIADDLLSTCILAAPGPVVFVPAMNDVMWRKAAVQRNLVTLAADGHGIVPPTEGIAAVDGRIGPGAMPDIFTILRATAAWLAGPPRGEMADAASPHAVAAGSELWAVQEARR
jgi:phosphopantothenoylcysteine decarboxylase/phosphopantothenate--cysteine ligase